jgi:hypothetical protein
LTTNLVSHPLLDVHTQQAEAERKAAERAQKEAVAAQNRAAAEPSSDDEVYEEDVYEEQPLPAEEPIVEGQRRRKVGGVGGRVCVAVVRKILQGMQ